MFNGLTQLVVPCESIERDQFQAQLRAHVRAPTAQDALVRIEDRIHATVQAAAAFANGPGFVIPQFNDRGLGRFALAGIERRNRESFLLMRSIRLSVKRARRDRMFRGKVFNAIFCPLSRVHR